jgi:hypothetical protein
MRFWISYTISASGYAAEGKPTVTTGDFAPRAPRRPRTRRTPVRLCFAVFRRGATHPSRYSASTHFAFRRNSAAAAGKTARGGSAQPRHVCVGGASGTRDARNRRNNCVRVCSTRFSAQNSSPPHRPFPPAMRISNPFPKSLASSRASPKNSIIPLTPPQTQR